MLPEQKIFFYLSYCRRFHTGSSLSQPPKKPFFMLPIAAPWAPTELTLDIYGKGGEEQKLRNLIKKLGAENYVILRGQQNLKEVYQDYELYLSGSMSEGFGLTLMEAIGGGLPIIGFDVRYGNPTFIDEGKNGYLIPVDEQTTQKEKIEALTDRLIRLFTEADLDSFHERSYEKARGFLTKEVELRWKNIAG